MLTVWPGCKATIRLSTIHELAAKHVVIADACSTMHCQYLCSSTFLVSEYYSQGIEAHIFAALVAEIFQTANQFFKCS